MHTYNINYSIDGHYIRFHGALFHNWLVRVMLTGMVMMAPSNSNCFNTSTILSL